LLRFRSRKTESYFYLVARYVSPCKQHKHLNGAQAPHPARWPLQRRIERCAARPPSPYPHDPLGPSRLCIEACSSARPSFCRTRMREGSVFATAVACGQARLSRPAAAAPPTFAPLPHCPPAPTPHLARRDPCRPRVATCTCRGGASRCRRPCRTPGARGNVGGPGRTVSRLGCLDTPTRYTLLRGGPRQPPPASSPASSLLPGLRCCVVSGVADTPSHLSVPGARQRARAHPPFRSRRPHGVYTPEPCSQVPHVRVSIVAHHPWVDNMWSVWRR
jgi:hypothetical protein